MKKAFTTLGNPNWDFDKTLREAAAMGFDAIDIRGVEGKMRADEIEIFPQVLKNARVKNENKGKFREDPEVEAAISAAEKDLEGEGRVLIRPSGTEPLVRVMLEGQDVEKITEIAEKIAVLLTKKFG